MSEKRIPRLGTIKDACKIIGGEQNPISPATYYRGVKRGIYDPPFHPAPNVSRVDLDKIEANVRALMEAGAVETEAA